MSIVCLMSCLLTKFALLIVLSSLTRTQVGVAMGLAVTNTGGMGMWRRFRVWGLRFRVQSTGSRVLRFSCLRLRLVFF